MSRRRARATWALMQNWCANNRGALRRKRELRCIKRENLRCNFDLLMRIKTRLMMISARVGAGTRVGRDSNQAAPRTEIRRCRVAAGHLGLAQLLLQLTDPRPHRRHRRPPRRQAASSAPAAPTQATVLSRPRPPWPRPLISVRQQPARPVPARHVATPGDQLPRDHAHTATTRLE